MIMVVRIRAWKQRTDIGKYSFVNRKSNWNQLHTDSLATFSCKSHIFRNGIRKVIVSEEKFFLGLVTQRRKVQGSEKWVL